MAIFENTFTRELYGRRKIVLNLPQEPFTGDTFNSILDSVFEIQNKNCDEITYLYNYYRGKQDILDRSDKLVRPEINNKVVENWAKHIVDFKTGFIWGEPIQLINNFTQTLGIDDDGNKKEATEEEKKYKDKQVTALNTYFSLAKKGSVDKEAGFWASIAGVSYICVLPNVTKNVLEPFTLYSLDPRETFVVYGGDLNKEPVMAVSYYFSKGKKDDLDVRSVTLVAYTKKYIYEATLSEGANVEISNVESFVVRPNVLGMIPIVELDLNTTRQGSFETVIPLLNNVNLISSDRMNDVEQAVQWFMKFINVDIDQDQYNKFKAQGVIIAKGEPGSTPQIDCVVNTLDQTQIQMFKDDMIKSIHIITNVPERNADPGDNTGQALIVGQGWADAEADAKNIEIIQKDKQIEIVKLALRCCDIVAKTSKVLTSNAKDRLYPYQVEVKYTRNRSDNLMIKTQSLKNMLDSGVSPLLAFERCGLFSDPQKAYEQSKPYLDWFYSHNGKTNSNEKTDIGNNAGNNEYNMSQQIQSKIDAKKNSEKR